MREQLPLLLLSSLSLGPIVLLRLKHETFREPGPLGRILANVRSHVKNPWHLGSAPQATHLHKTNVQRSLSLERRHYLWYPGPHRAEKIKE